MREGEIVDAPAVTKAVERLWTELGLGKGEVRLGIASPRVVASRRGKKISDILGRREAEAAPAA